jgi:hypothetical protein
VPPISKLHEVLTTNAREEQFPNLIVSETREGVKRELAAMINLVEGSE